MSSSPIVLVELFSSALYSYQMSGISVGDSESSLTRLILLGCRVLHEQCKNQQRTPKANQFPFSFYIPACAGYPSSPERYNGAKGFISLTSDSTLWVFPGRSPRFESSMLNKS
jgi:hypothetical protein